jgi:hypothetical protein
MKQSLMYITPQFDCRRMVKEYMEQLYQPAHEQHLRTDGRAFPPHPRAGRGWNARVREVWDRVRFVDSGDGPTGSWISGRPVPVRATIDLAGLGPGATCGWS